LKVIFLKGSENLRKLPPVLTFLSGELTPLSGQRVLKDIEHFEERGLALLNSNKLKSVTGIKGLYELRTPIDGVTIRVFFQVQGGEACAVHAINKKSRKIPLNDRTLAERRGKEYLTGGKS
jgi:phage-related protein